MTRINLLLLLAVVFSALYLVRVQYESRRLTATLDRAEAQGRALAIEADRLEVDQRAQSTPARVERLARSELQMRVATPAITRYVRLPETSAERGGTLPDAGPPPVGQRPLGGQGGNASAERGGSIQ